MSTKRTIHRREARKRARARRLWREAHPVQYRSLQEVNDLVKGIYEQEVMRLLARGNGFLDWFRRQG